LLLVSESDIRYVICEALESAGYSVLKAGDMGDAVDRLKQSPPDLFMVRHYTENISGHDAAIYLRKMCPGIPVLLVGGILYDVGLQNREIIQGFEIFPKPFRAAELLEKVREVLVKHPPRNHAARKSG